MSHKRIKRSENKCLWFVIEDDRDGYTILRVCISEAAAENALSRMSLR